MESHSHVQQNVRNGNMGISLAKRDNLLSQIESEIRNKERFIVSKTKDLNEHSKLNVFLREVYADYRKYSDAILDEKSKQRRAMEILHDYVDSVVSASKDIDAYVDHAKQDQLAIMHEINKIKVDIDALSAVGT